MAVLWPAAGFFCCLLGASQRARLADLAGPCQVLLSAWSLWGASGSILRRGHPCGAKGGLAEQLGFLGGATRVVGGATGKTWRSNQKDLAEQLQREPGRLQMEPKTFQNRSSRGSALAACVIQYVCCVRACMFVCVCVHCFLVDFDGLWGTKLGRKPTQDRSNKVSRRH